MRLKRRQSKTSCVFGTTVSRSQAVCDRRLLQHKLGEDSPIALVFPQPFLRLNFVRVLPDCLVAGGGCGPFTGSRTQNRGSIPPYSLTYNEVSGITFYYPNINLILVWCALEDSLWGATSSRLLGESGTRGSTPAAPPPMLVIKSFSHRHSEAEIAG